MNAEQVAAAIIEQTRQIEGGSKRQAKFLGPFMAGAVGLSIEPDTAAFGRALLFALLAEGDRLAADSQFSENED